MEGLYLLIYKNNKKLKSISGLAPTTLTPNGHLIDSAKNSAKTRKSLGKSWKIFRAYQKAQGWWGMLVLEWERTFKKGGAATLNVKTCAEQIWSKSVFGFGRDLWPQKIESPIMSILAKSRDYFWEISGAPPNKGFSPENGGRPTQI